MTETTVDTATPASADSQRQRPWPAVNEDTAFFWDGLPVGELRIQRCGSCAALAHPPRPRCAACGSFDLGHVVASGRGRVYSHVTFHKPLAPPFTEPYSVAVIGLDEGTRLISQVIGVSPDEVHVDMPVEATFVEVEPGLTLPLFRPTQDK
ncbi:OB-fold domain-containing protein [Pseudonocardia aurantiaca]|uniref:Zn-ribbon domain-containing OB-fold protein n=1 Tax=Pseudonocardia aurantiaca TaxID=75290 RepID=A0ABW4FQG1_9PSEU